jgi:hypothetical protein
LRLATSNNKVIATTVSQEENTSNAVGRKIIETKNIMPGRIRTVQILIGSHVIVFFAGFAAGKLLDYEELENYRVKHETLSHRITRHASHFGLAILAISAVTVVFKLTSRKKN